MKKHYQILIIGGGTAGIMTAAQLMREDQSLEVALIEPSEKHYYQPAWTLVGAGTFNFSDTEKAEKNFIPKNVKWIKEYAASIEAEKNQVTLKNGDQLSYDYLVVAPGIQIDLDGVEGLRETLGKNGVCSNYTNPDYTWEVLRNFKGGRALFTQANTPVKCGGAPQKIMYLAADYLQKNGLSDKSEVKFVTPGSVIFGVKDFAETLQKVVDRNKIETRFFYELVKIDGEKKTAWYRKINEQSSPHVPEKGEKEEGELIAFEFDMLHLAPPQRAPEFVSISALAHQDGPGKGWMKVDDYSLQNPDFPNVFGLGDVVHLPTAKTGAAVRKQAPVVVANIISLIKHQKITSEQYNGYSSCPLVTAYGKMVLAEFNYGNVRASDPILSKFMDTSKESWFLWILKKYILPYLYWNKMLKGKM